MDEILIAILLGIVEGITEFLPISSTGHLILVNEYLGFTGQFANSFDLFIQFGAILAVLIYFRNDFLHVNYFKASHERSLRWDILKKVFIALLPAAFIGILLGSFLESHLFNPVVVASALILGGIVIILIEQRERKASLDSIQSMSLKVAFLIGFFQCLAFIPGTSRSAATIIGALLLGSSRLAAAKFSFYLAIPTLGLASIYSLWRHDFLFTNQQILVLSVGFITSFFVAWLIIALFMKYISHHNLSVFGYYRIVLGILVLCSIYL